MKSDEGFLSSLFKTLSYAVLAGTIYYFGTYFWVSLFTRDEGTREKYAEWGLLALPIEIILLVLFFIYHNQLLAILLSMSAIHAWISLAGAVLNTLRFIISLFLKSDQGLYKSTIILFVLIAGIAIQKFI